MSQSEYSVNLFILENEYISIHIQAYFKDENLVIEGYDIGKRVKEAWGDSDYEYSTTISANEVRKLYSLLNVPEEDKSGLLSAIQKKFNANSCYSEFNDFLSKNGIISQGFSWT